MDEKIIGKITGKILETTEYSNITRYRGQRGPDKTKRNFPAQTLKNLPQFRNKSHQEVRQYIIQKKGVDIGGNFNFGGVMLCILVILVGIVGVLGIAKWLQQRQEKN